MLTAILLTIEALYYNVVLTTGPTIFLVLIYGSWSAYFVTHRTGNGITRDSQAWRTKLFYSYVIMIVILVKVIWALFMLQIWSDYGAVICSKSQSVDLGVITEEYSTEIPWVSDLIRESAECQNYNTLV